MGRVVLLVRHCEATGQQPDAPLTARGAAQAEALGSRLASLGVDRVVSSPWRRAVDSIAPFAARSRCSVATDARLRERALCADARPDWRERLRESFDAIDARLDGGESTREAMARVAAVIEEVARDGAERTAIVTHGNLLALALAHVDGARSFDRWAALSTPDAYEARLDARAVQRVWREEVRRAARAIALDRAGRVLLALHQEPGGRRVWATPGGRLEAEETYEAALVRELREELGVDVPVGDPIAADEATLASSSGAVRQEQRYFAVDLAPETIDDVGDVARAEGIVALRWWTVEEIATTSDVVFPANLAAIVGRAACRTFTSGT